MLAMRGVAKNAWGEEESRPCYKRGHSGQRATGIALGAVGVGLAILGIPLALVAAKAFASKAEAMANGNSQMIGETNNLVRTVAQGCRWSHRTERTQSLWSARNVSTALHRCRATSTLQWEPEHTAVVRRTRRRQPQRQTSMRTILRWRTSPL